MMARLDLGGTGKGGKKKRGGGLDKTQPESANNSPSWSVLVLRNRGPCAHRTLSEVRSEEVLPVHQGGKSKRARREV